ncbi:hypothetical protein HYV64_00840 [Candidatus Shapirobacteria bacterium]|nr:hypothetical protein [Candidatus Shapirobacteria bacterium]
MHLKITTVSWLWFTLPISVLFHIVFHQSTPLMKILTDPNPPQFYIALAILLVMVYLGIKKIKWLE